MFLLNEIIDNPLESSLDIDELIHFQNDQQDFEFQKGDYVYFNDYELQNLFNFFRILKYSQEKFSDFMNFPDFMNFDVLYNINKGIIEYVNCIGQITKIKSQEIKFSKGKNVKKKYEVEIKYPNDKILKIKNIKYLRLSPNKSF